MYVDDLNLVGTLEEFTRTAKYLKKKFELKDLRKTKNFIGIQIKNFPIGVLVHQPAYTKKILKRFHINEAHPLSSPMVVYSLDMTKDLFSPCGNSEELLGSEVPYLSAIGTLMYLVNYTSLNITFLSIY